ncbi:MAG: hypothetical protein FWG33_02300 [Oscillospiraceae bacterium]|nr:hypothetical protein [Oscillospiraceae bacterium]
MKKVLALVMAAAIIASFATVAGASSFGDGLRPDFGTDTPSEVTWREINIDEHFGKWSGSGTASCRLDTAPWRFERLDRMIFDDVTLAQQGLVVINYDKVAGANWTLEGQRTVITLSENYIKSLTKGMHWFSAIFWVDDAGWFREFADFILLEIPVLPTAAEVPATAAPAAAPATAAAGAGGAAATGGSTDVPRGGVAFAIIPTFLAAGVALVSKKRK